MISIKLTQYLSNVQAIRCVKATLAILLLTFTIAYAQADIPMGTWRMHLSYNNIKTIAFGAHEVYAASDMGVLIYNRDDNSISTLNKLSGLSGVGITDIAYNDSNNQLIIVYEDGAIDLIKDDAIINFTRLRDLNTITGSKRINHISVYNQTAYFATDYGLVVFDLKRNEVKETWRDLGREGTNLRIVKSIVYNDSISLATSHGVLTGSLGSNLLDYNNWKRFDVGELADTISSIERFNGKTYICIDGKGLFQYKNQSFVNINLLNAVIFQALESNPNNLLITGSQKIWSLSKDDQLIHIADDSFPSPRSAKADNQGVYWVADSTSGLVSNVNGDFTSYLPNGPTITSAFRLKHVDKKLYALSGGFNSSASRLNNSGLVNYFEKGLWKTTTISLTDLTDIVVSNNRTYISSFGEGLLSQTPTESTVFNNTNSPLQNANPSDEAVYITSLTPISQGVLVANYGANQPIHLLKPDDTWHSFNLSYAAARYPLRIATDLFDNVWITIDSRQGGGIIVLNTQNGESHWLNESPGSGALPNSTVRSLALDLEGNMWAGTDSGVAYFYSASEDAVKPIFENRFLLKDEMITAIAVDGGNRKWIGTQRGAWLLTPTGESMTYHFTTENSPLPSDLINDIALDHQSGEVFISTEKGIVSFRADATSSGVASRVIKIFPNPITADFSGTVGITGLVQDAIVKITDVSGKLIWQVQANGGTATWNVRDYKGRKASTGVYLVFASREDGTESMVGKIAVIE